MKTEISLIIKLPAQANELETAIRNFCRANACYDTAIVELHGKALQVKASQQEEI